MNEFYIIDEQKVAEALFEWFKKHSKDFNHPAFWNKNPVGQVIKFNLKELGRWKNHPRGNPKKALEKTLSNMNEKL